MALSEGDEDDEVLFVLAGDDIQISRACANCRDPLSFEILPDGSIRIARRCRQCNAVNVLDC